MLDPALLERARHLRVATLAPGRYRVTGGRQPHVVDCTGPTPICDCADHQYRGRACKHIAAVDASRAEGNGAHAPPPADPLADLIDGKTDDEVLALLGPSDAETPRPAPPRFHLVDGPGLDALPTPTWIVDGLIPAGGVSVIYGPPGAGKSFVALDGALAIATGRHPWLGRTTRQGSIVYVAAEGGGGLKPRRDAWCEAHGVAATELTAAYFLLQPVNLFMHDVTAFLDAVGTLPSPPLLLVFDTLALSMAGGDENSTADMTVVVAALRCLAQTGAAVLVLHHMSKDGRWERGSIALRGGADTMCKLELEDGVLTLTNDKQRDAVLLDPLRLRLRPSGASCVVEPADGAAWVSRRELSRNDRRLLQAFREVSLSDETAASVWVEAAGLPKPSFYRSLKRVIEGGYVVKVGRIYRLTELGKE
jgi:hypothetical protein